MIIYRISNSVNEKVYIGQTTISLSQRWVHHKGKWSTCLLLKRAIEKYGFEKFKIECIDTANSLDELNEKEIFWINYYKSNNPRYGYNIRSGGENSPITEETKRKLRFSHLGKKHSKETILKFSIIRKNMSIETRRKMSESRKGKVQSEETKQKRVKKRLGYKFSEEALNGMKLGQKIRRYKEANIDIKNLTEEEILGLPTIKEYRKKQKEIEKTLDNSTEEGV